MTRQLPFALLLSVSLFLAFHSDPVKAQGDGSGGFFTVSGKVFSQDNEPMSGVSVQLEGSATGTATDARGRFSLKLPEGDLILTFNLVGYNTQRKPLSVHKNLRVDVQLSEKDIETGEVVVLSKTKVPNNVRSMEMGVQRLSMKTLKKLPSFLGEVDIIKGILTLPGVSTVGEGASGFNVRGGGVDENLILMDNVNVFNSSHLFGFFSIYNPDAVSDATLIKGGIPAEYGGRLSSILDVTLKEGDYEHLQGTGGIGTVSSRFAFGGPMVKNRSSFFVSARRTYADLFLKLSKDPNTRSSSAYFYDLNGKLDFRIGKSDKLDVSGYYGRDAANFAGNFAFGYGNGLLGVHYYHRFNNRLRMDVNATLSNYDNSLGVPNGSNGFNYKNSILDYQGKVDFNDVVNANNRVKWGASLIDHVISPGKFQPVGSGDSSFFKTTSVSKQVAYEAAVYAEHTASITPQFSIQYGLRLSLFDYVASGNDSIYSYSGPPTVQKTPVDRRLYTSGQTIKAYYNLEPRISLRYLLPNDASIKASYNRTAQYIHLISNTSATSPFDIWASTSNNIKPEKADQAALGYFKNFHNSAYESSVEVYYKKLYNQIDYINGAQTLLNKNLEGALLFGQGRSYGAEFYVKKNTGKLNGWISYTLSKSERQVTGINNDQWYPQKYDRTHNLTIAALYDVSKRVNFGANFTYQTGVTTTFPNSRYVFEGIVVPYNSSNSRNNYRLPSYNRLDLAVTLYNRVKPGRKFNSNWVFSLYNVYSRRNPYTIFFRQNKDDPNVTEAVRLSILGSVIPGITWNFNF